MKFINKKLLEARRRVKSTKHYSTQEWPANVSQSYFQFKHKHLNKNTLLSSLVELNVGVEVPSVDAYLARDLRRNISWRWLLQKSSLVYCIQLRGRRRKVIDMDLVT